MDDSYHLAIATAWSSARREKSEKSIGQRIRWISVISVVSFIQLQRGALTLCPAAPRHRINADGLCNGIAMLPAATVQIPGL